MATASPAPAPPPSPPLPPPTSAPANPPAPPPNPSSSTSPASLPATAYRFRLLAENAAGATPEEEATFTTQPPVSPGLPDNRAYELLTPPDKEGAEDMFGEPLSNGEYYNAHYRGLASESGNQFMLDTAAAFGPFPASGANVYVFTRRPSPADPARSEWAYTSLASPALGVQSINLGVGAYDPLDFSHLAFTDLVGSPSSQAGYATTALLGSPGGPYTTLHADQAHPGANSDTENTQVLGASADLSHVVFSSSTTLSPPASNPSTPAPSPSMNTPPRTAPAPTASRSISRPTANRSAMRRAPRRWWPIRRTATTPSPPTAPASSSPPPA